MGYHLPCHSFSTKEQTAYPFFSRFIYPVYFFCIPFPPPHLTFPLSPPHPNPLFFPKRKKPQLSLIPFSFRYMYTYSSALKGLSASFFSLFHPLTVLPTGTHYVSLLYISLSFLSCLLYISGLSLVVRNFSIHSL